MKQRVERRKKHDWGLVVIGILLVLCGMIFIFAPDALLVSITIFMGAAFLVTGIFDIISYVRFRDSVEMSGWIIAYAVIDIIIGGLFLFMPIAMAMVIPWVVGIFFIIFGVFEIMGAIKMRKAGLSVWGWMLFSGIMSTWIGVLLFIYPPSISIIIGVFVVMRGLSLAIYGLKIDNLLA